MKRLAFSDDMMRAIASGEKTMTRRPIPLALPVDEWEWTVDHLARRDGPIKLPRIHVGELVAATCAFKRQYADTGPDWGTYRFDGSGDDGCGKWTAGRFMPARLAPFVLRMIEVRAEQLGKITEDDARREGMTRREWYSERYKEHRSGWSWRWHELGRISRFAGGIFPRGKGQPLTEDDLCLSSARMAFASKWISLYGSESWDADKDSWTWAYGFEIAERRI